MSKTNKAETAEDKLDLTELSYALSQIALKIFMGKEVTTERFTVELDVPTEIVQVLKIASEKNNTSLPDLLSHLASRGLDLSLQLNMNKLKQPPIKKPTATSEIFQNLNLGLDSSANEKLQGLQEVMSQLGQLGSLASRLEEVQKVVENVDNATPKKNNS
jgi:hypothetical protein